MSQELHVVRCYNCNMFQVDIVKKVKKWQCKMCNAKQMLQQVYFKGSGKDCRINVQNLNAMKQYESQATVSFETSNNMYYGTYQNNYFEQGNASNSEVRENMWAKYLDTPEDDQSNTFKNTNNESNYEDNDDPVDSHNREDHDNSMCPDNDHSAKDYWETSLHSEGDTEQDIKYDSHQEYDIKNETFDDKNNSDGCNKTTSEVKDAISIFDDNEDFDIAIDF